MSRLTLMRRNGIASLESPLLASTTSASAMISEAVADGLAHVPRLRHAQARVNLDARDEESLGGVDLLPPAKVIIALVEDVGRTCFEFRLTADLDVIDGRRRNLDTTRDIVAWMIVGRASSCRGYGHSIRPIGTSCPTGPGSSRSTEPSRRLPLACVDRPSLPAWRRFPRKRPPDDVHSHARASSEERSSPPNDNADGSFALKVASTARRLATPLNWAPTIVTRCSQLLNVLS